jgi:hypothetical protein
MLLPDRQFLFSVWICFLFAGDSFCQIRGERNPLTFDGPLTSSQMIKHPALQKYISVSEKSFQIKNYAGQVIINGTVEIDNHIVFINCPALTFGEKAKIILQKPDVSLTIKSCTLKACTGKMWSGIFLNNTQAKLVMGKNTGGTDNVILDADTAVYGRGGSDVKIETQNLKTVTTQ